MLRSHALADGKAVAMIFQMPVLDDQAGLVTIGDETELHLTLAVLRFGFPVGTDIETQNDALSGVK